MQGAYAAGVGGYLFDFQRSLVDPEGFWATQAEAVDWYTRPSAVLDASQAPLYRWFSGGCAEYLLQRTRPARDPGPRASSRR
jgi:hypothetical protein